MFPGHSGGDAIGMASHSPDGAPFADAYHAYAIEWEPSEIRWYVDSHLYQTRKPSDLPAGARWVFDHEMFMLFNVAVGGAGPGIPIRRACFRNRCTWITSGCIGGDLRIARAEARAYDLGITREADRAQSQRWRPCRWRSSP
jgi:Glycosyl hydrolases family 16